MQRCCVGSDRQGGADVVAQHRSAAQRGSRRSGRSVGDGSRGDREVDRGDAGISEAVGHGVSEGVRTGVAGGRRVDVRAVRRDRDGAVSGRSVGRDAQPGADVIAEHRGAVQRGVGRRGARVVHGTRSDRDVHGSGRGLPGSIGHGVSERVWPGVVGRRRVDVGAACRHGDRAVQRCGITGDGQRRAEIVGDDRRAVEHHVGVGDADVVHCDGRDSKVDGGRRRASGGVGRGVGEGVRAGVAGRRGVRVRAVGRDRHRAVGRRSVGRDTKAGTEVVGQNRRAGEC